jgi:hypothetical protein
MAATVKGASCTVDTPSVSTDNDEPGYLFAALASCHLPRIGEDFS